MWARVRDDGEHDRALTGAGVSRHLLQNDMHAPPMPTAVDAEGVWITDAAGKRYLDGCSGAIVSNIGHGHPRVVETICDQAARVTFAHRTAFTTEPLTQLADELCEYTGYDAAWFVGSGSEATEAAIQLAVQFHRERGQRKRTWFLSFRRGYHGNTLGGLSLSGNARRDAVLNLVHDFPSLPEPYAFRDQGDRSDSEWTAEMLATARLLFEKHAKTLAGIVVEPVGGATMGATVPPIGYLQGLQQLCHEYGGLFIADEVMTGMGRCGTPMAAEQLGVQPDIAVMGKGLGAGYTPIAAALISPRVHEQLLAGSARILGGHTYAGNPLSAATALAVLRVVRDEGVLENAERVAPRIAAGLAEIQQRSDIVADARGLGMLQAIELTADKASGRAPDPQGVLAREVAARSASNGLILYPTTGGVNDALIVAPPLTITDDEVDVLLEKLAASLQA